MGLYHATVSPTTSVKDDVRWWLADDDEIYKHVTGIVRRIRETQSMRKSMDTHHMRLYGNIEITGYGPDTYWRTPMGYEPSTLAFNAIRQVCDTVQAKIAKNRPLPQFVTTRGNYSQQKRARNLGRFVQGEFDRCEVFELGTQCVLDAGIFGTGLVTVYRGDDNRVHIERVFPFELVVDALESQYGKPRSIYQRRWVDKHDLIAKYPDKKEQIEGAQHNTDDDREASYEATSDLVLVVEAWRLPAPKGKNDERPKGERFKGKHAVVINNTTLKVEEYDRDYFPFVALYKNKPVMGWWGTGFAQELTGLQYEINFTAMRIQKAHRVMGGTMYLVDSQSEVVASHLQNDAGVVVKYKGREPKTFNPLPVHPDSYRYLLDLRSFAPQEVGVSQMAAQAQKPPGITAGIALETLDDIETERFFIFGRNYEQWSLELARQLIEIAKEIQRDDPSYAVRVVGKRKMEIVKFSDVDMERDEYVMQVFPTSLLAKTPSARLQQITDWVNIGWLSSTEAKLLMDMPDLESVRSLATASHELVEEMIERMTDGDPSDPETFHPPEPLMDLDEALRMIQFSYLRAKLDGVPEENLELLRRWWQICKDLKTKAQAPANDVNQAGAAGVTPGAPAGPGPTPSPPAAPTGVTAQPAPMLPTGTA